MLWSSTISLQLCASTPNTGSALAAIISPVIGGFLIDKTGNWEPPFVGSMVLMGVGVVRAFRMQPEQKFALDGSVNGRGAVDAHAVTKSI